MALDIGQKRRKSTITFSGASWQVNGGGLCLQAVVSASSPINFGLESLVLPASNVTFTFKSRKTNPGSGNATCNCSNDSAVAAERCFVAVGYAGDNIFFDWGGAVDGSTRIQVTTASSNIGFNSWMLSTGPAGMRVYKNGILVGSNNANPTRTIGTGKFNVLGGLVAPDADQMTYLYVYRRQLPDSAAIQLAFEPYALLTPKAPRVRYFTPAAAATSKATPSFLLTGVGV